MLHSKTKKDAWILMVIVLVTSLRDAALKNKERRMDFDGDCFTDADYLNLMGVSKDSFDDICKHVKDIRHTAVRSIRTCLGIFLTKLRSGMSNKMLSTLFNVGPDAIKRAITSGRKALMTDFVPKNIGFNHVTREEIISNHTRHLAQTLFGGPLLPAILVIDGTYIYIQKSSKFQFPRRSYNMHKHRPLVKPMIFVSTTGYIVSVLGPYLRHSKNNDAEILKHALKTDEEAIRSWLQEDDIFIVDRDFRDSIDFLEAMEIKSEMPSFLKKNQKQHTVEESNTSRLVPKLRWVVESVNGRLKTWRFLNNIVPNSQIPYIRDYVQSILFVQ
ncbi:uncharacterized protein LOC117336747 [Pecten maximus]|uniref:uncharacterized protein LOC117336747 n=1 Tax=Pecten maximus TaxID=6579 RepID=UPI00145897ED|nr:uncharacterized protein LOC117336747 [Pecten maximus]